MPTIVETTPLGRRVIDPDVNRRFNIQTQMQADQMGQQERMRQAELQAMREIQGTYGQRQAGEERLQGRSLQARERMLGQELGSREGMQTERLGSAERIQSMAGQQNLDAIAARAAAAVNQARGIAQLDPTYEARRALGQQVAASVPDMQLSQQNLTDISMGMFGAAGLQGQRIAAQERLTQQEQERLSQQEAETKALLSNAIQQLMASGDPAAASLAEQYMPALPSMSGAEAQSALMDITRARGGFREAGRESILASQAASIAGLDDADQVGSAYQQGISALQATTGMTAPQAAEDLFWQTQAAMQEDGLTDDELKFLDVLTQMRNRYTAGR